MSSQKFESLDEDIEDILDKVSKKIEIGVANREYNEELKRIILKIDQSLDDAHSILNKMEIEARRAPKKYQERMKSKVLKYGEEIKRHRKYINQHRYPACDNPSRMHPVALDNSTNLESNIRGQILMGAASLDRTAASLDRSRTVAIETEQLGTEVLGELGAQRETLERTRDRLADTQNEISRIRKILIAIKLKFLYNKIMLIIIIILEACILAGLVYWKFFT